MYNFRNLVYLLILIGVGPALAYAEVATLFDPITSVRGKGKPTTEVKIFNLAGFRPPFTLHLQNGKQDGSNRASRAKVWLNGQLLFGSSDFSQQVSGYVVPVELTYHSSLKVWLASKRRSELTLWIEGVPNMPPMADAGPDQPSDVLATLFGPITSVRGKGKPTTEMQIFNLAGFRPPFTLHLQNGKQDGSNRASRAKVWLNGQLLFGSSDFSQQVSGYVVPVELTDHSSLKVWLAGKRRSELTLWIEGVPNTPPMTGAGPDQPSDVLAGDVVILDGSASSDPDGNALTYSWSLVVTPDDSAAELSDPTAVNPSFHADKPGTYTAVLTVNDGFVDSVPDDASITVVIPPPMVSIDTPENLSVVPESPVTITGTVDDPLATVTVDGDATPNNNGNYSAAVELLEGENTVTVVAINSTGEGNASVDITLRSSRGSGPAMRITTPRPDFTAGQALDEGKTPSISVAVSGIITTEYGIPTVMVNGVAATIISAKKRRVMLLCDFYPNLPTCDDEEDAILLCDFLPKLPICDESYIFSADIDLSKGEITITAEGQDATGGSTMVSVSGVADYCFKGVAEAGVFAERGNVQNNRCHEIDGCSVPGYDRDTNALRNRPMPYAVFNKRIVEFGSGFRDPIQEFFVHGQKPRDALGCNIHDTCYQTCVPSDGDGRDLAFDSCNVEQGKNHNAMCRKAYPDNKCPFTIFEPIKCAKWRLEKEECFLLAKLYVQGVMNLGQNAYNERQVDYCVR